MSLRGPSHFGAAARVVSAARLHNMRGMSAAEPPTEPRGRRAVRRASILAACLGLAAWPFAFRYTSVGLDFERGDGDVVRQTFVRLLWPGDGSVALAWIAEHRDVGSGAVEPWDLGGALLEPAPRFAADGFWQQCGFHWLDADAQRAPVPALVAGADRAVLVGAPHGLFVAAAAALAAWLHRRRRSS